METDIVQRSSADHRAGFSSAPRVANAHVFDVGQRTMLLSVNEGRVYEIAEALVDPLDQAMEHGDAERVSLFMAAAGMQDTSVVDDHPPTSVPVRALSLAVAQKCNLGCTYCYAQHGNFGGADSSMPIDVAMASVDGLLREAAPGERVSLAFLGGEPLVNRAVLRAASEYAAAKAAAAGVEVAFALTTNATLLDEADADFFDRHRFAITVSIDGGQATHDLLRPFKSGRGSYGRVIERAKILLSCSPRRYQVTARVTVTPRNLFLRETLDELVELGFDGVLFSPMLSSPTGLDQMSNTDFDAMLVQMIDCADEFERRLNRHVLYPFSNVISTLRRIHQGNRDAYPCGAGGGYLGVSSKGDLFACHRFVDNDAGAMGNVGDGIDRAKQQRWLLDRNVHRQEPCRTCWARYLCSGGCHHEAIHRGRPACDYIRGWLHHCLALYGALLRDNPLGLHRVLGPPQMPR
jgi:uncharacterized protein